MNKLNIEELQMINHATSLIESISNEIMSKRAKIIDDFAKAYIAGRSDIPVRDVIRRLKLIETVETPTRRTYHFELKRGKLKNNGYKIVKE